MTEVVKDEIARCQAQIEATKMVLPLRTGEKKTQAEYKILFLETKIATLKSQ